MGPADNARMWQVAEGPATIWPKEYPQVARTHEHGRSATAIDNSNNNTETLALIIIFFLHLIVKHY